MSNIERELQFIRRGLEAVLKRMEGRLSRPVALSMSDAAHAIGVGDTKFAEMVRAGIFNTFRVNRRRLVRVKELEDWAEREQVSMMSLRLRQPKTQRKTEGAKARAIPKR